MDFSRETLTPEEKSWRNNINACIYHFRCLHCSISTWCKTWRSRFCVGWLVDHCQDSCRHLIVLSSVGMWASRHIRLTVLLTSYGVRVVGIAFDLVNEKIYIVDFLVCSIWLRRGLTPHFHTIFWLTTTERKWDSNICSQSPTNTNLLSSLLLIILFLLYFTFKWSYWRCLLRKVLTKYILHLAYIENTI